MGLCAGGCYLHARSEVQHDYPHLAGGGNGRLECLTQDTQGQPWDPNPDLGQWPAARHTVSVSGNLRALLGVSLRDSQEWGWCCGVPGPGVPS